MVLFELLKKKTESKIPSLQRQIKEELYLSKSLVCEISRFIKKQEASGLLISLEFKKFGDIFWKMYNEWNSKQFFVSNR